MPKTANPDTVLAHVRVLRLTDRLLAVADELRHARDDLQAALDPAAGGGGKQRRGARG